MVYHHSHQMKFCELLAKTLYIIQSTYTQISNSNFYSFEDNK